MCFKGSGGGPMEIPPNKQVGKVCCLFPHSTFSKPVFKWQD